MHVSCRHSLTRHPHAHTQENLIGHLLELNARRWAKEEKLKKLWQLVAREKRALHVERQEGARLREFQAYAKEALKKRAAESLDPVLRMVAVPRMPRGPPFGMDDIAVEDDGEAENGNEDEGGAKDGSEEGGQ